MTTKIEQTLKGTPEELANYFIERFAKPAHDSARSKGLSQKDQAVWKAKAETWEIAASLVRQFEPSPATEA